MGLFFLLRFCVSRVYLLCLFLFRLYYQYRTFLVNYIWWPLLLFDYGVPFAALLFSLPSSFRFWVVLLVGLFPSTWEVFFCYASRGLRFLFLSALLSRNVCDSDFDGIAPYAPPLFLHPSLLHRRHVDSLPSHLCRPRDFIRGEPGLCIICAFTWVFAFVASSARLLFLLARFLRPLGTLLFSPFVLLVSFVFPLILISKFINPVRIIPSRLQPLPFIRIMAAIRRCVAVKVSYVVASLFSVRFVETTDLKKSTESVRAAFVRDLPVGAPPHFRLIDCRETLRQGRICLVDWQHRLQYTAISHTWGMPLYAAFDCACATIGYSAKARCDPYLSCPQTAEHRQTIQDILCMCKRLHNIADVNYIWHDGVCIAQHDKSELYETMKHMAWIYGNAKETVIFFHYVGKPLVPVAPLGDIDVEQINFAQFVHEWWQMPLRRGTRPYPSRTDAVRQLLPRWFCRAWTYQEALVAPKRRYCVRLGVNLASCWTLADLETSLKEWDEDESAVQVLEEEELVCVLRKLSGEMMRLMTFSAIMGREFLSGLAVYTRLMLMIMAIELRVWPHDPSILLFEASSRECTNKVDRLNSMLGLAGLGDFVVREEGISQTLEASTVEFLNRMGQKGLARAMRVVNSEPKTRPWNCSWVPDLDKPVRVAAAHAGEDDDDHMISSMEVAQEGGAAELKMKVSMAACVPIHLSRCDRTVELGGGLIMHARIMPVHSAILWRKRVGAEHLGLWEELGTCVLECDQHNRLYEDDTLRLFLVCSPRRLQRQIRGASSSWPAAPQGGGLLWTAPSHALLLSQDASSDHWFKVGFMSSVSTGLLDALRSAPLADRHFCIH